MAKIHYEINFINFIKINFTCFTMKMKWKSEKKVILFANAGKWFGEIRKGFAQFLGVVVRVLKIFAKIKDIWGNWGDMQWESKHTHKNTRTQRELQQDKWHLTYYIWNQILKENCLQ